MFYKNYSVGYCPDNKKVCILKYDQDMTSFKENNRADHIIAISSIDTYKFENYQNYLDKNGLFMGVFPPEFIESSIKNYYDKLKKEELRRQQKIEKQIKEPILETKFKKMKDNNFTLNEVLDYIDIINNFNLENNGMEFSIEKYYRDILIKYWGNYKV